MRGYTKVQASREFILWLNAVWNQYLGLICYPDRYIKIEKVERSLLGIKLKPKLRYVHDNLPDKIDGFVCFSTISPFGDGLPRFRFVSSEYENIPELVALLDRGEGYLDGEMVNLYNELLQRFTNHNNLSSQG